VQLDVPINALRCLEMVTLRQMNWRVDDCDDADRIESERQLLSFFSPAQLPALQHLVLDNPVVQEHGGLYDALLPQLTHLHFDYATIEVILPQLQLCTALKSLRINWAHLHVEDLSLAFIKSFKALNLEEFHFGSYGEIGDDEEWQRAFPAVQKLVGVLEDVRTLKKLSLLMDDASSNANWAGEWIKFKKDVRKMCSKQKIEIVCFDVEETRESKRDELAWVA
jgi:hypothetical protein